MNSFLPFLRLVVERVDDSARAEYVRVSLLRAVLTLVHWLLTHPTCAALCHPLYAKRKEGKEIFLIGKQ